MKNPGRGGDRDTSKTLPKVDANTQQGHVLEALKQRPMSAAELQWSLPLADARAVVRDLRRKGIPITTKKHPDPSRPSRCVQRYHLAETD
ncbi:helix-turn-helix domain-containing protein [Litchfieldella qijiaojingensis]